MPPWRLIATLAARLSREHNRNRLLQRHPIQLRAVVVEDAVAFLLGHVGGVFFR